MDRVGEILKTQRLELGISLEEISQKTKLSVVQLKALEEGNIGFFKDDLSYLSYYVRYYANALNIDYNEIRSLLDEAINDYTQSITISEIEKIEKLNQNIKKRTAEKPTKNISTIRKNRRRSNFDVKSFTFMALAILISFSLLFVLIFNVIIPAFNQDPKETPIVDKLPDKDKDEGNKEEEGSDEKPEEKPSETKTIEVKPVEGNITNYDIMNWTEGEDVTIEVNVKTYTWLQFSENNIVLANPQATVYDVGEVIKIIVKAEDKKNISVRFGAFGENEITINGQAITIDPSLSGASVVDFEFTFVGGEA